MARKFFYLLVALAAFTLGTFLTLDQQKEEISTRTESVETLVLPADSDNQIAPDYFCFFGARKVLLAHEPIPIDFDDLKVKNIGLGLKESLLTEKFGRPLKNENVEVFYCEVDRLKELSYEGIKFGLLKDENGRNYNIYSIKITSSNWVTKSGIKIGDDIEDVIKKFGTNYEQSQDSKHTTLDYSNNDGNATFTFQNNKLVKINWQYNFC